MPESFDATGLDFLWSGERHTSLRQLLRQHFALPVPLRASLETAAQAWGLAPETGVAEKTRAPFGALWPSAAAERSDLPLAGHPGG